MMYHRYGRRLEKHGQFPRNDPGNFLLRLATVIIFDILWTEHHDKFG